MQKSGSGPAAGAGRSAVQGSRGAQQLARGGAACAKQRSAASFFCFLIVSITGSKPLVMLHLITVDPHLMGG